MTTRYVRVEGTKYRLRVSDCQGFLCTVELEVCSRLLKLVPVWKRAITSCATEYYCWDVYNDRSLPSLASQLIACYVREHEEKFEIKTMTPLPKSIRI